MNITRKLFETNIPQTVALPAQSCCVQKQAFKTRQVSGDSGSASAKAEHPVQPVFLKHLLGGALCDSARRLLAKHATRNLISKTKQVCCIPQGQGHLHTKYASYTNLVSGKASARSITNLGLAGRIEFDIVFTLCIPLIKSDH